MAKKKKPELLWTRSDLFFGPDGVSEISKPKPLLAVPAADPASPNPQATPRRASGADYTVAELAREWRLSPDKNRELFRDEPGVVKFKDDNAYKKRKRPYVTLRIPPEVAQRVKRRLS
jgi:hypothetical protein